MTQPRLSQILRTSTGHKFYGIFRDPEDRFEGDEIRARRILRVSENTPITTGSVITRATSDQYLLFEHSQAQGQKRFLAYQITHIVPWVRIQKIMDPVTQMKGPGVPVTQDPELPIVVEPHMVREDLNMKRTRYKIRTPAGVEPGDTLGKYQVNTVQEVLGACIIEAF